MKAFNNYTRAVEKGHQDEVHVGKPKDQTAEVQSDNKDKAYPALGEVVQDILDYFRQNGGGFSNPHSFPMAEVG
jgi:hypothetical protein